MNVQIEALELRRAVRAISNVANEEEKADDEDKFKKKSWRSGRRERNDIPGTSYRRHALWPARKLSAALRVRDFLSKTAEIVREKRWTNIKKKKTVQDKQANQRTARRFLGNGNEIWQRWSRKNWNVVKLVHDECLFRYLCSWHRYWIFVNSRALAFFSRLLFIAFTEEKYLLVVVVIYYSKVDRASFHTFQDFCILCIQYVERLWYTKILSEPLATIKQYRISFNRNTMPVKCTWSSERSYERNLQKINYN